MFPIFFDSAGLPFLMFFMTTIASLCLSVVIGSSSEHSALAYVAPPTLSSPTRTQSLKFSAPSLQTDDTLPSIQSDVIERNIRTAMEQIQHQRLQRQKSLATPDASDSPHRTTIPTEKVSGKHYVFPPTDITALRKRYGTNKNEWGDWSQEKTRAFYRTNLPRALQIDGALGLTLEERAKLASEARHALRVYSRERCFLPYRVAAQVYDGIRHFQLFGYYKCDGMNWSEVKEKYSREAYRVLGESASRAEVDMYVYRKVVDRACVTNPIFDQFAAQGTLGRSQLVALIRGIFDVEMARAEGNMVWRRNSRGGKEGGSRQIGVDMGGGSGIIISDNAGSGSTVSGITASGGAISGGDSISEISGSGCGIREDHYGNLWEDNCLVDDGDVDNDDRDDNNNDRDDGGDGEVEGRDPGGHRDSSDTSNSVDSCSGINGGSATSANGSTGAGSSSGSSTGAGSSTCSKGHTGADGSPDFPVGFSQSPVVGHHHSSARATSVPGDYAGKFHDIRPACFALLNLGSRCNTRSSDRKRGIRSSSGSASGSGTGSGKGSGFGGDVLSSDVMVLASQLLDLNVHYWTLLAGGPPLLLS